MRSEETRVEIATKNGIQIIMRGLTAHQGNNHVLANGFHALSTVAAEDEKMHIHITMMRGVELVARAMSKFKEDIGVMS